MDLITPLRPREDEVEGVASSGHTRVPNEATRAPHVEAEAGDSPMLTVVEEPADVPTDDG